MKRKISVIIPTYNDKATLCQTIDSVLCQSRLADEILVVDDGGGYDVKELLGERTLNLRIIRHETNLGVSAARNTPISETVGEYVLFLDADDILHPEFLAITSKILDEDSRLAACFTDFHRWYNVEPRPPLAHCEITSADLEHFSPETGLSFYLSHTGAIGTSFTLVRKKALLDIEEGYGMFHPSLKNNQDFHYLVRLLLKNNTVFVNKPYGIYLLRSDSLSSNKLPAWSFRVKALTNLLDSKDRLQMPPAVIYRLQYMRSSAERRCGRLMASQGHRFDAIKMLLSAFESSPKVKTLLQIVLLAFYLERRKW